MIKFGPSGNSESFIAEKHKSTEEAAKWVKDRDLDCYEYSFGRGVNLGEEKAKSIGEAFKNQGVSLSVHAPYFINFATEEEDKAKNSFGYILSSAAAAKTMGANRVIFHPASQGKSSREDAVKRTARRLEELKEYVYENGFDDMFFCPETMGKLGQIGTIEEITDFCKIADFYLPTVDFGHVNAREQGSLKTERDYADRLSYMIDNLGFKKMKNFHVHFSKIQYSAKGEVRHLTFADDIYGPEFEPLASALVKLGLEPVVVCESAGTQAEDAAAMKRIYFETMSALGKR